MLRLAPLLTVCLLLIRAEPAAAASPNVIILQGDLLSAPIVLDDWGENLDFMLGLGEPQAEAPSGLDGRRELEVALFWAVSDYLEAGVKPLELLDTEVLYEENHETATLYLGTESEPPVLDYKGYRVVNAEAETILAAHGVPLTAVPEPGNGGAVEYGAFAAIVAGGAVLTAYLWRRRVFES